METFIVYNCNTEKTYGRRSTLEDAIKWRDELIADGKKEHEIVIYNAQCVYPLCWTL